MRSALGLRTTLRALMLYGCAVLALGAVADTAVAAAFQTKAREAYVVDFDTGAVLIDKNGLKRMPPSSMAKLMTAVMVFERLQDGSLSLNDLFRVSVNAWKTGGAASGGSTMFLDPGSDVRVEDLLRGLIIQSGNDACIVLAENLMGSEAAFAKAMNARAREIGLTDSHFTNASGLPDPDLHMTARDIATLAKYIITTFPEYYELFSETEFTYNNIKQNNRNPLLYNMHGADGLKTGHAQAAGYGLAASAKEDDRRVIMVLNGLDSVRARSDEARKIMRWAFSNFENKTLFVAGDVVDSADVWLGDLDAVPLVVKQDLTLTLSRRAVRNLDVKVVYTGPLPVPIEKGEALATLVVSDPDLSAPINVPLYAGRDVQRLGFFSRIAAAVKHLVFGAALQGPQKSS